MAEATEEELAELGVERFEPAEVTRMAFEEVSSLPEEPVTDVLIRLEDGTQLRERVTCTAVGAGLTFSISNALADASGAVEKDQAGDWRIVPPEARHEFQLDGVRAGTMSDAEIEAAKTQAREVAAAKAKNYFDGMDRLRASFAGRLP